MDTPESQDTIQGDLNELEEWAHVKRVRENHARYKALNLGQGSPWCQYRLGDEQIEGSPAEKNVLVLVAEKLAVSQQCALTARKTSHVLGCIQRALASRSRELILPLYFSLLEPHLKCCIQLWGPLPKTPWTCWSKSGGRSQK